MPTNTSNEQGCQRMPANTSKEQGSQRMAAKQRTRLPEKSGEQTGRVTVLPASHHPSRFLFMASGHRVLSILNGGEKKKREKYETNVCRWLLSTRGMCWEWVLGQCTTFSYLHMLAGWKEQLLGPASSLLSISFNTALNFLRRICLFSEVSSKYSLHLHRNYFHTTLSIICFQFPPVFSAIFLIRNSLSQLTLC